jgi:hypothetical protein
VPCALRLAAMQDLPSTPPPTPTGPVRGDALERADTAWRARVAGATWRQAAEVAGYADAQSACHSVRSVFGELPAPSREDLREVWRARLELLWSQALRDSAEQRAGAVTAGVRVAGMAITLDGLAEPTRLDLNVTDTFEALTRELIREGL